MRGVKMGKIGKWHNLAPLGGKGCVNLSPTKGFREVCGFARPEIEGETGVLVETCAQVFALQGPRKGP